MEGARAAVVNRALNLAFVSSIALHAALLFGLSMQRDAARREAAPGPIEARLVEPPPPPPAPALPQAEPVKPPPPRGVKPVRRPKPAPVAKPAPAPVSEPVAPAPATEPVAPAPPSVAKIEPRPALAAPSAVQLEARSRDEYRLEVINAARSHNRYPPLARENNWEGEVLIRMVIGADGGVSLSIKSSSKHAVLDRQALEMFKRAQAQVPLPASLRGKEFSLELRAIYYLKDQVSG
jgi:protein TonB